MTERKPRLEGKVAIVTGAGSRGPGTGNGKATAILFAREGAKVMLVDLFKERALETHRIIREEKGESAVFEADLTKESQAREMVEYAIAQYGRLDILHNNVGIGMPGSVLDMTEEDWDRILAVNVKSLAFSSKYAILEMMESGGGSIINISSIAAMRGLGIAAYALTKGGIIALTRTMAVQHAKDNIRVNCIAPGTVYTPMVAEGLTEEGRALRRDSVPLGTEGTAWDIGWAAVYLASDEARWVTGVVLPVDGGLTITTEPTVTRSDFVKQQ
ncbi:MAG TPA: SDR family oxidoreductase [Deltaproteobacteria bacterium]|nr:SDR family oxidoreductase [Deltaproteobacteria bacterium]